MVLENIRKGIQYAAQTVRELLDCICNTPGYHGIIDAVDRINTSFTRKDLKILLDKDDTSGKPVMGEGWKLASFDLYRNTEGKH